MIRIGKNMKQLFAACKWKTVKKKNEVYWKAINGKSIPCKQ